MEEKTSCMITVNGIRKYFDKMGNELHEGDTVVYENGREEKLYLTTEGELGTDATNKKWIETGKAVECEYGIYPLEKADLEEIVLKKEND